MGLFLYFASEPPYFIFDRDTSCIIMPIEKVAKAIVKVINCPIEKIVPDAELEALGIDSLKAINILFELEEEFDIEIPNELIAEMNTVGDIVDCVQNLRDKKP